MTRRVAVVGGGISGLAAAYRLAGLGVEVILIEQASHCGGKLRTGDLAGWLCEEGAETFLAADPDAGPSAAVRLATEVGLGGDLVYPAGRPAAVAVDGGLTPIPAGTVFGIPGEATGSRSVNDGGAPTSGDPGGVGALAVVAPGRDVDTGRPVLGPGADAAVGALVRARYGDRLVDRLVDPLLGGVYAGRADELSLEMTVPALAAALRREHTLGAAVRRVLAERGPTRPGSPVFATVAGGLTRLVEAVGGRLRAAGVTLLAGRPVRELARVAGGWRLTVGATTDPTTVDVDAVVLAVPARPAARLLAPHLPTAPTAAGLDLEYASVALIALALPGADLPDLSGLLVPAGTGYATKAVTFFGRKWTHQASADGVELVRLSMGRAGEEAVLRRDDADLVDLAQAELAALLGGQALPAPVDTRVHRWGGALPQYRPGHAARVAALRTELAAAHPGLFLAGAAFDGVGIAACVRSGFAAADTAARGEAIRVTGGQ